MKSRPFDAPYRDKYVEIIGDIRISLYWVDNKRFWSYIKNLSSSGAGVAPLKKDGRLTSDPREQAEVLNSQFQSVFGDGQRYTAEEFNLKTKMTDKETPTMGNVTVSCEGIKRLLRNLNPHKAGGPDGISSRVLKELAEEIAPALTCIFQSSLSSGVVPADWRSAYVTPLFKKGEQYNPANYRPVSLTCIACKLLEHVVVSSVMQHFESHGILIDNQHGFRRGRSCETQLLEFVEELMTNLEEGKQTDILIMDFAKAFDRVNHSLLVHKLHRYGIRDSTLAWIENFLEDRHQAVVVNGHRSSFISVRSGVPQGSVLGPCLFLAYINDLPEELTSLTRLFADDTAVYRVINDCSQQLQLQQDLNRLAEWENSWDMQFHPAKCVSMPITRRRNVLNNSYTLHGHTLDSVTTVKYLGVTLQQSMCWDSHINNVVIKANRMLGFLRRNLKISSSSIKEKAYKAFVRPLLEYASSVWDPYDQRSIDKLEAVQRRAARFVLNRYHNRSSVSDMLDMLRWPSLQERRKSMRLKVLSKVKNGLIQCPTIKAKLVNPPSRQRRTHDQQFRQITTRTQYRAGSFLPRTIKDWNALTIEDVEATESDIVSQASI